MSQMCPWRKIMTLFNEEVQTSWMLLRLQSLHLWLTTGDGVATFAGLSASACNSVTGDWRVAIVSSSSQLASSADSSSSSGTVVEIAHSLFIVQSRQRQRSPSPAGLNRSGRGVQEEALQVGKVTLQGAVSDVQLWRPNPFFRLVTHEWPYNRRLTAPRCGYILPRFGSRCVHFRRGRFIRCAAHWRPSTFVQPSINRADIGYKYCQGRIKATSELK